MAGGGEGSPRECEERGVFLLGVPSTPPYGSDPGNPNPHPKFDAAGASDAITLHPLTEPIKCQQTSRKPVPPPSTPAEAILPVNKTTPFFLNGQTVRVKLKGDLDLNYAEFGPVTYFCPNTHQLCYGLFWDFKLSFDGNTVTSSIATWEPFEAFRQRNMLPH